MKKTIYFFALIFLMFITVILTAYLQRNNFFYCDDLAFGLTNRIMIIKQLYYEPGGFISQFINRFLSSLFPAEIGIHPSDFIGFHQTIINGFILFFTLFSIASFSEFYKKSQIIFLSALFFIFSLTFYTIVKLSGFTIV